jgi:hypothetical protein
MYDATPHWVAGNKAARPLQERALVIDKPAQSAGSGLAGGEADICDARGCRAGTPTRPLAVLKTGQVPRLTCADTCDGRNLGTYPA